MYPVTRCIGPHPEPGEPVEVVERSALEAVEAERSALQEIVCRYDNAVTGTQYVGSEGLTDVFKARESIWRDNQEVMEAAQRAKRTGSSTPGVQGDER